MKITGFIYNEVIYYRLKDAIDAISDKNIDRRNKQLIYNSFIYSSCKVNNIHFVDKTNKRVYIKAISIKLKPQVVTALSNGDYYTVGNQAYLGVKRFKELGLMY